MGLTLYLGDDDYGDVNISIYGLLAVMGVTVRQGTGGWGAGCCGTSYYDNIGG